MDLSMNSASANASDNKSFSKLPDRFLLTRMTVHKKDLEKLFI